MSKRLQRIKEVSKRSRTPGSRLPADRVGSSDKVKSNTPKYSHLRSNSTIRRLQMYREKPDVEKMKSAPKSVMARLEPGRKWFNNTRVVTQENLNKFREALRNKANDPSSILVKRTKLPVSLFDHSSDVAKKRATNLLTIEPFSEVFSASHRRKRPKLEEHDLLGLISKAESRTAEYYQTKVAKDRDIVNDEPDWKDQRESVFLKGTSRRIWGELYKVVDSSDVVVQVLDARNPMGTRCAHLERHIKKDKPFKHVVLLLNKCDLVPNNVAEQWVRVLSKEYPTVAFRASIKHPFGKRNFINLLRQFSGHLVKRKTISVGFIGYPNVGKSSVINTLRAKKVCTAAPVPGETKVWQYIALTSKVYLIDCPGIVASLDDETGNGFNKILKGVVRAERLTEPEIYIEEAIQLIGRDKLNKVYSPPNSNWTDAEEFLDTLARKRGRLLKGGEPDIHIVATQILHDLQRGKLPYFFPPHMKTPKKDPFAPSPDGGDTKQETKNEQDVPGLKPEIEEDVPGVDDDDVPGVDDDDDPGVDDDDVPGVDDDDVPGVDDDDDPGVDDDDDPGVDDDDPGSAAE